MMIDYIDYLVMLLSTDWFKPYWVTIGLEVDEPTRDSMQEGCRGIVKQILSGAENYFFATFSEQRRKETHSALDSLVERLNATKGASKTIGEWAGMTHEDSTAAWVYTGVTRDLFSSRIREGSPKLDPAIKIIMAGAEGQYDVAPTDFLEICAEPESCWDEYIKRLTPEQPTFLADILAAVSRARRFRAFWDLVVSKLTPEQRHELVAWYGAMAKSGGGQDIAPSYVS
jgi:hypothetical protein